MTTFEQKSLTERIEILQSQITNLTKRFDKNDERMELLLTESLDDSMEKIRNHVKSRDRPSIKPGVKPSSDVVTKYILTRISKGSFEAPDTVLIGVYRTKEAAIKGFIDNNEFHEIMLLDISDEDGKHKTEDRVTFENFHSFKLLRENKVEVGNYRGGRGYYYVIHNFSNVTD